MQELVHYADPMTRAMRTQAILDVYQIPHRKVLVEVRKGDHKKAEYGDINPLRKVPALAHGDTLIIESGAITLYLADLFAEKMKTPKPGTPERARLYEWLFFLQSTLEPVAIKAFDPDQKETAKVEVRRLLDSMGSKVTGPYILGEEMTVADVIVFTELSWYKSMGTFPEGLEPYVSFMARVAAQLKTPA